MIFSFVSFITSRGFYLKGLENIVYDDVLRRHDDFNDDVGMFFNNFIGITLWAEGRGPRKMKTQNFNR